MDQIASDRAVEVEQEDLERALASMARAQRTSSGALRRDLDKAGRLGELKEQLRREKVLLQLIGDDPPVDDGDDETGEEE